MKLRIESIVRQTAADCFEGEIVVSEGQENRAFFSFQALRPFETSREVKIFCDSKLFDGLAKDIGWNVGESMLAIILIQEIGEVVKFLVSEPLSVESTVGIVSMVDDPTDGLLFAGYRHPGSQSANRVFENETEIPELVEAFRRWCKPIHEGPVTAQ